MENQVVARPFRALIFEATRLPRAALRYATGYYSAPLRG